MRRGFTLIEVLVTIVLVSVAVVGVLGGLRVIAAADAQTRSADLMQRLVAEKLGDMRLLSDPAAAGSTGDFSDRGYPEITWTAAVEATGAADVDKVTVTATGGRRSQAVSTLIFVRPTGGTSSSETSSSRTFGKAQP